MLDKVKVREFEKLVESSKKILVLQPDSEQVDPDSIRSALALSGLLEAQGKEVIYYLSGELPKVFQIITESDKFTQKFPSEYDVSILVDCGGPSGQMPETIKNSAGAFQKYPFVVIDHHANRITAPFPTLDLVNPKAVATSEVLYEICNELGWEISPKVAEHMIWSILSDSRCLTLVTDWRVLEMMGELAKISHISVNAYYQKDHEARNLPRVLFQKKIELMNQIEFHVGGKLAIIFISKAVDTLFKDAGFDSPGQFMRIEMSDIQGVELYMVITENEDGSLRGSTRSSDTSGAAIRMARSFGGGGHDGAAGFMVADKAFEVLKKEIVELAEEILQ